MQNLKCHCGAIKAEINTKGNFDKTLRCNCSLCKRKGAVMSMVKNEDFKIVKGEDKLKLYQFHTLNKNSVSQLLNEIDIALIYLHLLIF